MVQGQTATPAHCAINTQHGSLIFFVCDTMERGNTDRIQFVLLNNGELHAYTEREWQNII